VLPNPTRWGIGNGRLGGDGSQFPSLPNVKLHHIFAGIVKRKGGKFKRGYLMQSLGKVDEQLRQAAVVDHKIRHL